MRRVAALLCFSCVAFIGHAQYPFTRSFEIRIGLQRPHLTSATQGPDGLVWAGSELGLLRTDGVRHELILRTEPAEVTAVAADARSVFAALSSGVIIRCRSAMCDTLWVDSMFVSDPVRAMVVDGSGQIWLGTYGAGAWIINDKPGTGSTIAKGLPDDHVNALCALSDGRVAVATDQGVSICDAQRGVLFTVDQEAGAPDNLVMALAMDSQGRLLAGTESSGVFRFGPDDEARSIEVLDPQWAHGPVRALADASGATWIGTDARGTVVLPEKGQGGAYLPPDGSARSQRVRSLFKASDDAMWWCDGSDLLTRSDPNVLFVPHHEERDLRNITALDFGRDGRIWFAGNGRVFSHAAVFADRERLAEFVLPLDPNVPIVGLHVDERGAVWVGTMGRGIYRILPAGHIDHFTQADGSANDNVLAIRSAGGRIWFATLGGICYWSYAGSGNDGSFTTVAIPGSGFVFDVLPLADGGVLAATDGNGVIRVDITGRPTELHHARNGRDTYYSLCMDDAGEAWACGPGTGLCRVRETALDCSGAEGPPFDGEMYGMAPYRGRIIAIGRAGVVVFDKGTGRLIDPGDSFGLKGIGMSLNAIRTAPDGSVWLACDRGLVRMRPSDAALSDVIPAMITDLHWGNVVLPLDSGARFGHDRNFLSFGLSALRTASPEELRFEYRLAGFDRSIKETRDRQVSYSQLPPGHYRFEVRAGLGDRPMQGGWNGFAFTILAPWWARPWAIILGAVLAAAVVLLLVRSRDERLRFRERMERERVRFQLEAVRSQVNPHFLFNSFNTLIGLIEEDRHKAVEHVEHLSDFFRNILQVRDKDVITLNEELHLLDNYFFLEKRRFGGRIAMDQRIGEGTLALMLPPLTLQLLVENAIKHNVATNDAPLHIEVIASDDTLIIRNPLRPRAAGPSSTGFGLDSIKKRFAVLTTRPVVVNDQAGAFEVRIPLLERAG